MFFQNGSKDISNDIEYICKLIFQTLKIPIYFLDNNNDIYFSYSYKNSVNPLHKDKKEFFNKLFSNTKSYKYPIIKSTEYIENYFSVSLFKDNIYIGMFVVGPSVYCPININLIEKFMLENNITLNYKRDLINFYSCIPIIDSNCLIHASQLLYYLIYNVKLEASYIIENNSSLNNITYEIKNQSEINISKNLQDSNFHHTFAYEQKMFQCVSEGDKEKLQHIINTPKDGEEGILSKKSHLRSRKNLVISVITLATRAAMNGGLNSELAYSLSDSYIQQVEEIDKITDLVNLQNKMLFDFTERVEKVKKSNYPKIIVLCQHYIFEHLYEEISLLELSNFVGLSKNYLSELFSQKVGITISKYIQRERIKEAKRLLIFSNYSILDISTLLKFHDQSHFTRTFKEFIGITPKKYRNTYFMT